MPHILIAGKLHPAGLALLGAASGVTFDYVEEISEPSYQAHLAKADGMVIRTQPLGAASVAKAGALKIVSRHGVGYDAVDVAALNARKIPLCIVGDVNSAGVAEHAMMLILAATHRLIAADRETRAGNWGWRNGLQTQEVRGKRLLIILSAGGRAEAYQPDGFNRFTIREFLAPIEQTAYLCGMAYLPPLIFHGAHRMTFDDIDQAAGHYRHVLEALRDDALDLATLGAWQTLNDALNIMPMIGQSTQAVAQ